MEEKPFSVIIPAHNEAAVIERCLRGLLAGARPGELEVIVVCNGCTDDTAARARSIGDPVRVLETPVPSKSRALNMGDGAACGFPRFYIDADIAVSVEAIRHVGEVLRAGTDGRSAPGPILAAAPRMRVRLDGCSWPVRAFYNIWTRLPYCAQGMIGSGFYALSEAGRRRFGEFPPIISDDGYVRLLFTPAERAALDGVHFDVHAPRYLASLVRVKTRSQFDNRELARAFPHLRSNDPRSYRTFLRQVLAQPGLWPQVAVYTAVLGLARLKARLRWLRGRHTIWDRDDSSRRDMSATRPVPSSATPLQE